MDSICQYTVFFYIWNSFSFIPCKIFSKFSLWTDNTCFLLFFVVFSLMWFVSLLSTATALGWRTCSVRWLLGFTMRLGPRPPTGHEIYGTKPVSHLWKVVHVSQSAALSYKWVWNTLITLRNTGLTNRYQSITALLQSWYEERQNFSYPNRCSGSVCSHYTQVQ